RVAHVPVVVDGHRDAGHARHLELVVAGGHARLDLAHAADDLALVELVGQVVARRRATAATVIVGGGLLVRLGRITGAGTVEQIVERVLLAAGLLGGGRGGSRRRRRRWGRGARA